MQWEEDILLWIQESVRNPVLTPIMQGLTHSTDKGAIWLLLAIGMSLFPQTRRSGIICLVTIGIEVLVVNVFFKHAVARIRPFDAVEGLHVLIAPPDDFSFPSGHTAISFAASAAILLAGYKRTAIALFAFATLIGFSRIYLGVHYVTDVLAGAVIGVLVAYGVRVAAGSG